MWTSVAAEQKKKKKKSRADAGFGAWMDRPWPQVTDSMFFIWSLHLATLQSLFSIRKRNACGRKVEAGRERGQHTHTQTQSARGGKEASRNTEDKMAFIRTAVEGQRSLIFSSFCSLSSFLASFHLSCEAYGRAPRFQIT